MAEKKTYSEILANLCILNSNVEEEIICSMSCLYVRKDMSLASAKELHAFD